MVAELALEPRDIVNRVEEQSHVVTADEPPLALSRPAEAAQRLRPVRQSPDVEAIHAAWSRVHAAEAAATVAAPGLRARLRARMAARTPSSVGAAQRDDRALIGDLIRATDLLAGRCDELADRVADLEALVEEIVCVVSEDLTHVRAVLADIDVSPGRSASAGASEGTRGPAANG